jgi:Fe-S-cluster-containing dehydrogenase component
MVIDITKCNGCYNCFLSCRDEYCGNDYPPYSVSQPFAGQFWMRLIEKERGNYPKVKVAYIPVPCMHCEEAPCIAASSNNAVYRRPDGIVIIDPEKAVGQKEIIAACPHRVIYWNKEKDIPQKCTFCAHLLDKGWKEPRCVESCPTGALVFGDLTDPNSEISKIKASREVEVLHPEYGLKPGVCYIGFPKRFIAGEVILADREDECAQNVSVLLEDKTAKKTIKTDNFGDFEFEGLEPDTEYTIKIEHEGYAPKEFSVNTRTDVCLGEIVLDRA